MKLAKKLGLTIESLPILVTTDKTVFAREFDLVDYENKSAFIAAANKSMTQLTGLHNPVLILADEPTGNLDSYSSEVIWNLLKGAKEHLGTTVLVVTHHIPSTLSMDYKHYFLEGGILHEVR